MIAPKDYILVQLDKAFEDTITTESGFTLIKNTRITPEWDATATAKVVSVPRALSNKLEYKGLDIEVEVGDEIVISYMVIIEGTPRENDTYLHKNLFIHEGKFYWKVDYQYYLGKVKESGIQPAQGYVYCEPMKAGEGEEKIGLLWMPEMSKRKKPKGKAKVTGVGRPKKGAVQLSVNAGDTVRYPERLAQKYTINGKDYIILPQYLVLAKEN